MNAAIIDRGAVLLTLREDFECGACRAGHGGAYESLGEAAVREVCEETGLDERLDGLVGMYSRPNWLGGGYSEQVVRPNMRAEGEEICGEGTADSGAGQPSSG